MKKELAAIALMTVMTVQAQETGLVSKPRFSGYGMAPHQASFEDNNKSNSFNLRILRVSVSGTILNDFAYLVQGQLNGNSSSVGNSAKLVDYNVEWQKYKFFRVKFGQYKRPFTFENPMNPIDQGFMSYGQNVTKLSGFNDRSGEHSSAGRDMGLQFQGDFLENARGRSLVHYQVGVFNGQGINTRDLDNRKDVIGGLWVMPVEGMRIGLFGWEGSHARKGMNGTISLPQHRYAISGEYLFNDWTIRSEYIHSTGYGFKDAGKIVNDKTTEVQVDEASGNKADGIYALVIAPVIKKKLHVKARYDMYRPSAKWSTAKTQYEVGIDYEFHRNLEISGEYALVNDRSLDKHNYSMLDVELSIRF